MLNSVVKRKQIKTPGKISLKNNGYRQYVLHLMYNPNTISISTLCILPFGISSMTPNQDP